MSAEREFVVEVRNRLLTPAEAEVWVTVTTNLPGTVVRGRLMGPRCAYTGTVEVAYPLRPLPAYLASHGAAARVVIPEPSFWDPESPFLYQGPVTVWQGEQLACETRLCHGLRYCQLSPRGLRWNGKPLAPRGVARQTLRENDAAELRAAGVNMLLATLDDDTATLFDAADRLGFLVVTRLSAEAAAVEQARGLSQHPSCLGWLLPEAMLTDTDLRSLAFARLQSVTGHLIGVELREAPTPAALVGVEFVVCPPGLLPRLGDFALPKIVLAEPGQDVPEDVLGQVRLDAR